MAVRTWTLKIKGDESDAIRAANKTEQRYRRLNIDKGFGSKLRRLSGRFKAFGSRMADTGRRIARTMSRVALVGVVALGAGLVKTLQAGREGQKIADQTAQVIKTIGASSWTSAQQIGEFSDQLARQTGISDDTIQNGANLILTFKGIRNEVGKGNNIFDRTVTLANDMSVALGQDMKSSSIQLGKALNDPIKGVTALQRVGVSFTESQKEQIKALTESGDLLGAQKLILKEVEAQFGGTAEAVATPWDRLKIVFEQTVEVLGQTLLPFFEKVAGFLADRLPGAIETAKDVWRAFKAGLTIEGIESGEGIFRFAQEVGAKFREAWPHLQKFGEVVGDVAGAITDFFKKNPAVLFAGLAVVIAGTLLPVMVSLAAATIAAMSPFILVVGVLALVAGAVAYAYTRWEWFREAVDTVVDWFQTTGGPAIGGFIDLVVQKFQELAGWVRTIWPQIQEAIGHVLTVIGAVIGAFVVTVVAIWNAFGNDILEFATTAWDAVRNIIEGIIRQIQGIIQLVLALINGDWSAAWEAMKLILSGIWQAILGVIQFALATIKLILMAAWEAIKAAAKMQWEVFWGIISGVWERVQNTVGGALKWVKDKIFGQMEKIKDEWKLMWEGIKSVVDDIWKGIKNAVRDGANLVIGVINWFIRLINKLPGVDIPEIDKIGSGSGGGHVSTFNARERATGGMLTNGPQFLVGEGNPAYPEAVIATDPKYRRRNIGLLSWAADKLGVPGYQFGGIVDAVKGGLSAVGGAASAAADWARDLSVSALGPVRNTAKSMIDALPLGGHGEWMKDFAKGLIDKFYDWAKGKTEENEASKAISGAIPKGSGLSGTPAANRRMGQAMNFARGWGSMWGALDALVMSESGWNATAQNPTSTAYGIGQFLDSTWSTVGATKTSDARSQIAAMLRYIAQRFGNPSAAWRFKQANNWYRNGGISQGGWTHPGEMVLRPADQKQLLKVVRGRGGGPDTGMSVTVEGDVIVQANTPAEGRAAGKAFIGVLNERRVMTDARIS